MKLNKKVLIVILALSMLFSLAACGKGETNTNDGAESESVYVPQYIKVDLSGIKAGDISRACVAGDTVYMQASVADGTEEYTYDTGEVDENGEPIMQTDSYETYRPTLLSVKTDGTGAKELSGYKAPAAESDDGYADLSALLVDSEGNIWVLETVTEITYDLPEDFDGATQNKWDYPQTTENSIVMRELAADGSEIKSVDLSGLAEKSENGWFGVYDAEIDGSDNIYLTTSDNKVVVVDRNGSVLFEAGSEDKGVNTMMKLSDGRMAATVWDSADGGEKTYILDTAKKGFGDEIKKPANAWNYCAGKGEYDLYFTGPTSLYGFKLSDGESTEILNWINLSIDSDSLLAVVPREDGSVFCVSRAGDVYRPRYATAVVGVAPEDTSAGGDEGLNVEFINLVEKPRSEVKERSVISYACMGIDWDLRADILDFNRNNENYMIEVKDYSQYNTEDDWNAGLTKLTTEILAGKVPDLMSVSGLPTKQYAAKGLLEDLWPFIDADKELGGRDSLVMPFFKALESEGKLYELYPGFSVRGAFGLSSVVGDKPGWTLDEMMAAYGKMPEGARLFEQGTTKGDVMNMMMSQFAGDFVNWETGECSFDSQQFIDLLKLTESFPETFDWENFDYEHEYEEPGKAVRTGKQLVAGITLDGLKWYYDQLCGPDLSNITFIGYPTADGQNGTSFGAYGGLAMSSACENKDGAWQFMRTLLTEEHQERNAWGLPTNRNVMDRQLKDVTTKKYTTDENGKKVEEPIDTWYDWTDGPDGKEYPVYALDEASADKLMGLINDTTHMTYYDEKIMNIVQEETAPYFAGELAPEKVAANIQSRVSLYVNEQK